MDTHQTFLSTINSANAFARGGSSQVIRERSEARSRTLTYLAEGTRQDKLSELLKWINDEKATPAIRKARLKGFDGAKNFKTHKVGEWAKQVRMKYGYTQEEWSKLLGIPRTYVTAIEGRFSFTTSWSWLLRYIEEYGPGLLQNQDTQHITELNK